MRELLADGALIRFDDVVHVGLDLEKRQQHFRHAHVAPPESERIALPGLHEPVVGLLLRGRHLFRRHGPEPLLCSNGGRDADGEHGGDRR
jgi:hypothetical protein